MTVNHDVAGSSPAWGATNRKPVDDVSTGFFVVLCGRSVLELYVKCDNFCTMYLYIVQNFTVNMVWLQANKLMR